jgi:aryl-alcohol dehydrogenase-like predicted oxidoreductase
LRAKHPEVCAPIIGASKPHHLQDEFDVLELKLTD